MTQKNMLPIVVNCHGKLEKLLKVSSNTSDSEEFTKNIK